MHDRFNIQHSCRVLQWNEPGDSGPVYSAIQHGALVVADSEALLIEALTPVVQLRWAA